MSDSGKNLTADGCAHTQSGQVRNESHETNTTPVHESGFSRFGSFGILAHVLNGLGISLALFLFMSLAPEEMARVPIADFNIGEYKLFTALMVGFSFQLYTSSVVAIGVGIFAGRNSGQFISGPGTGGLINAIGIGISGIVLIALASIFAPEDYTFEVGRYVGPLIGLMIGTGIIGAGAGWLGERSRR